MAPVLSLTRKQAGKTVTRIIPSHAAAAIQARVAEYQRFRQLSKAFVEVNDALSEVRLAAERAPRAAVEKKRASRKISRLKSAPKSKR